MNPLELSFFKSLVLNVSEHLASLNLRLSIMGIQLTEKDYGSIVSGLPEYSHFAILQFDGKPCALHAGTKLIGIATDRLLGGTGTADDHDGQQFTFSEQFMFKTLIEWITNFSEQKEKPFIFQRVEHFSRSMHLFFHDEPICCVTLKLKLNQNLATTLQFILPQGLVQQGTQPQATQKGHHEDTDLDH